MSDVMTTHEVAADLRIKERWICELLHGAAAP